MAYLLCLHSSFHVSAEPYAVLRGLFLLWLLVVHAQGHPAEDCGLLPSSVISMIDEVGADFQLLGYGRTAHFVAIWHGKRRYGENRASVAVVDSTLPCEV